MTTTPNRRHVDRMPQQLHTMSLCSGGGGLDLAAELALGCTRCICWVEWEAFAAAILASRMEAKLVAQAPLWSDLRTFNGRRFRGLVDLLLAGYPCQPFSQAGKRRGADDPRHLWPYVYRVAGETESPMCFFENVSGHLSLGFDQVVKDLEALGHKVAAGLFTAEEIGDTHKRERLFILAMADPYGWRRDEAHGEGKAVHAHEAIATVADAANADGRCGVVGTQAGIGPQGIGRGRLAGGGIEVGDADIVGLERRLRSERERGDQRIARPSSSPMESSLFPPGPGEFDQWRIVLGADDRLAPAQSKVRMLADGMAADRARWLKALGNGVVPLQAAYAFCSLYAALTRRAA